MKILPDLPKLTTLVCLDEASARGAAASSFDAGSATSRGPWQAEPVEDVGQGRHRGHHRPAQGRDLHRPQHRDDVRAHADELPVRRPRPGYLALAPLTHAAGVLCFPVMTLGGEIVIMPKPDLTEFLALIERHRITHTFLPPTLIYMLLDHPGLASTDLSPPAMPVVRHGAHVRQPAWRRRWTGSGR